MPTDRTADRGAGSCADDRWPDVLARRLHAVYRNKIAVVNAGIGGNQVVGPAEYSPQKLFPGGPSAKDRSRPRCAVAIRHRRSGLARRHQRFQQERQCPGRPA